MGRRHVCHRHHPRTAVLIEPLERRLLLSTATLIKDINTTTFDASPHGQLLYKGALYFLAYNPADGYGLWRSDGTPGGTSIVRSVTPRPGASSTVGWPDLIQSGGLLYFDNLDVTHGWELWKSDGTASGTAMVKDIFPGPDDASPVRFASLNGHLYFFTRDSSVGTGLALWTTDGTDAGTQLVTTIAPSSDTWSISDVAVANNLLFFRISSLHGATGPLIYRSDGTSLGTYSVMQTPSRSTISGNNFFALGNKLGYVGLLSSVPTLYLTDGNSGTVTTISLSPPLTPTSSTVLGVAGGVVYLGANYFSGPSKLWKCDGSTTTSLGSTGTFASTDTLAVGGTSVYASASGGTSRYVYKLSSSFVGQLAAFTTLNGSMGSLFYSAATQLLYFSASDATAGNELWECNPLGGGARLADLAPGTLNSGPSGFFDFQNSCCFVATGGTYGSEFWSTDGTTPGTHLLADVNQATDSSFPAVAMALGNSILFSARDATHGQELWTSDGTAAGTSMVLDIKPGTSGSVPAMLGVANGWAYFSATDANGTELWKTDGTAVNTMMVKAVNPTGPLASPQAVVMNGILYFGGTDASKVYQLWRSDGTAAGTYPLTSGTAVGAAYASKTTPFLVVLNNTLIFAGGNSDLWRSDGTVAGTVKFGPNAIGAVNNLCVSGGKVFFTTSGFGYFYVTDGTDAGTTRLSSLASGFDSVANLFTDVNGTVYFALCINNLNSHTVLMKSDGTVAGTTQVTDINPGGTATISSIANLNGIAAFTLYNGTTGDNLWISDGTSGGTQMIAQPGAGSNVGIKGSLASIGGVLYFSANDGVNGYQLWSSDGTAGGTGMLQLLTPPVLNHFPLNPNVSGSMPVGFTAFSAGIFVQMLDDLHGREPWLINADPTQWKLDGNSVYLKADPDGVNVDAWVDSSTPGVGNPTLRRRAAVVTNVAITGDGADNTLTIDFSNGNPLPSTAVTYDGGGGVNTVSFVGTSGDDTLTAGPSAISFATATFGSVSIAASNVQAVQFVGGSGGNDVLNVSGSYRVDADTGSGTANVTVASSGAADVAFNSTQHLAGLVLAGTTDWTATSPGAPLVVQGPVSLGGALNLSLGYVPAVGDSFVLIDNQGSGPVSGAFHNLPQGAIFPAGGMALQISYVGGTGNDVVLTVVTNPPAPSFVSSLIGDGSAQRSAFNSFTLKFDQPVSLALGAVTMNKVTTDASGAILTSTTVDPSAFTIINPSGDGKTWVVAVALGKALDNGFGDFADGVYQFTLHAALITNSFGSALAGGDRTQSFHKVYGDVDGDGVVGPIDFANFRKAYGSNAGDPKYNAAFDTDHDGTIGPIDFGKFKGAYGKILYLPL